MEEKTEQVKYYKKRIFLFFTLFSAVGLIVGAIGGYLYYRTAGCTTGSCAITSSPWLSTLWGAAMGYLIGDLLSGKKEKNSRI